MQIEGLQSPTVNEVNEASQKIKKKTHTHTHVKSKATTAVANDDGNICDTNNL